MSACSALRTFSSVDGKTLKGRCPIHNGSNPTQSVVSNGLSLYFGDCDAAAR